MHVEFLVEEPSSAAMIEVLLDRLLIPRPNAPIHSWRIHSFDGKRRMIQGLSRVLGGILDAQFADSIVVLIDADRDDCVQLKQSLLELTSYAISRHRRSDTTTNVWVRIAVTELEAWFIGDVAATRTAYPRITAGDMKIRRWKVADAVPDAWEWLEKLMLRRRYYVTRMPKVEVARNIAANLNLDPNHNTSRSFRLFLRTLREVYGLSTDESSSQSPST